MEERAHHSIGDVTTNVVEVVLFPWRTMERGVQEWASFLTTLLRPWSVRNHREAAAWLTAYHPETIGKLWLACAQRGIECANEFQGSLDQANVVVGSVLEEQVAAHQALQRMATSLLSAGARLFELGASNTKALLGWGEEDSSDGIGQGRRPRPVARESVPLTEFMSSPVKDRAMRRNVRAASALPGALMYLRGQHSLSPDGDKGKGREARARIADR